MTHTKKFTGIIKSKFAVLLFACLLLSPAFSSAQSFEEQGNDEGQSVEQSSTPSGIWDDQNAASGVGSTGISTPLNENGRPAGSAGSGTPGASLRPSAGPTPDAVGGGGPGGNPDVPFDTNMNLMFLAAGIVFAFMVYKKRLKLKAVTAGDNK